MTHVKSRYIVVLGALVEYGRASQRSAAACVLRVPGELSAEDAGERSSLVSLLSAARHLGHPVRQRDDGDAE